MIPRLEDMTLGQRIGLTLLIVLVILFALAFCGWITGGWDQAEGQTGEQLYGDMPLDAVLIRLDKHALDQAYENRIMRLWEVWISPTTRDASSFSNGLKIARQRYTEAAAAIGRRERQLIELEQRHQDQRK